MKALPVRRIIPAFITLGLVVILFLLTVLTIPGVTAQDGQIPTAAPTITARIVDWYTTPQEWNFPYFQPGTSSGEAVWTFDRSSFQSFYPRGFEFRLRAQSNLGEITEASVIWSHAPGELRRREAEIETTTGDLRLRWFPDEDLPPWVAVNYYWSLADSAGNRYRTEWILGSEYEDETRSWQRFESDEYIIFAETGLPDGIYQKAIEGMESQRETFYQAWGGLLSYRVRVILFVERESFFEWQPFIGASAVGRTDPRWGATVQVVTELSEDGIEQLILGTVLHEIGHLYQFEFAQEGFGDARLWFVEGSATLFEQYQEYDYEQRTRNLAENNLLPILFQGFGPTLFGEDGQGRLAYDVGYTFWRWLVLNYGLEAHRRVIQEMAAGRNADTALEAALGISVVEMETRWREWLGASGAAPTLIPTPTLLMRFPPTATPAN